MRRVRRWWATRQLYKRTLRGARKADNQMLSTMLRARTSQLARQKKTNMPGVIVERQQAMVDATLQAWRERWGPV